MQIHIQGKRESSCTWNWSYDSNDIPYRWNWCFYNHPLVTTIVWLLWQLWLSFFDPFNEITEKDGNRSIIGKNQWITIRFSEELFNYCRFIGRGDRSLCERSVKDSTWKAIRDKKKFFKQVRWDRVCCARVPLAIVRKESLCLFVYLFDLASPTTLPYVTCSSLVLLCISNKLACHPDWTFCPRCHFSLPLDEAGCNSRGGPLACRYYT